MGVKQWWVSVLRWCGENPTPSTAKTLQERFDQSPIEQIFLDTLNAVRAGYEDDLHGALTLAGHRFTMQHLEALEQCAQERWQRVQRMYAERPEPFQQWRMQREQDLIQSPLRALVRARLGDGKPLPTQSRRRL